MVRAQGLGPISMKRLSSCSCIATEHQVCCAAGSTWGLLSGHWLGLREFYNRRVERQQQLWLWLWLRLTISVLCAVYDPLVGIPRGARESPLSVPSACVCFIFNFHRSLPASLFLRWNLAQRIFFHRFILFCYVWRRVVSSSCLFMIFFPLCVRSLFCLLFIVVMPALNECNKSWLPFIFIAIDHNIFIVQFIWFTSKEIKWTS